MKKILAIGLILLSTGCVMRCRVVEPPKMTVKGYAWEDSPNDGRCVPECKSSNLYRHSDNKKIAEVRCASEAWSGCEVFMFWHPTDMSVYLTMAAAKKAVEAELAKERSR